MIKKILTLCALVTALTIGCDNTAKKQGQTNTLDTRYITNNDINFKLENAETILTQIEDVQYGFVAYDPYNAGNAACSVDHKFAFLLCKGGDGNMQTYIYPHAQKPFRKYVPVELKVKRIAEKRISPENFLIAYITDKKVHKIFTKHPIEADGIIEPDGVKYLGDGK